MDNLLIAPFLETFLAAWRDLVGRHRGPAARQPGGRFFHGHYDCYLPLYVGNHVACSRLRPSNGAAGEELACIVERSASAGDRRSRQRRLPPRRDAVRRQQCRLLVQPGPQHPSGGARRQEVAQVAPPLRFDRQGLAPVLPLSNPGVVEPRAAGSRKSGAASSRSPLRRDLPELRAGRGADPLRRSPLRAGRTESRNGSLFADQTSTAILPPTHLCFATFASGTGGSKNRPRRRRGRQGPGRNDSDEVPRGCRLHLRAQNSAFVFFDLSLERTVPPGSWRTFGRLRWRSSRPQP